MRDEAVLATKVLISACVIYAIGRRVEFGQLLVSLRHAHIGYLLAAVGLAILAVPAVSVRWRMLAEMLSIRISNGLAVRATFAGLFVGQVLPGAIGADVVRGWMIWNRGLHNKWVVASLVVDRVVSLAAVGVMILLALPALLPYLPQSVAEWVRLAGGALVLALLAVGVLVRLVYVSAIRDAWDRAQRKLKARGVVISGRKLFLSLLLAMAGHGVVILSAYFLSLAIGVESSLWMWWLVMPIITLVTAIPISINGWGVRELAMVQLWALFGVARQDAFLISICMGLVAILSSLPGLWFWLVQKRSLQIAAQ